MSPQLPSKQKAVQVTKLNKPYEVKEVDVPDPSKLGPQDVLIKVGAASYCHTDSMVQSGVFGDNAPITASHEGAGTVVAVGKEVSKFKVGDRIMAGIMNTRCGKCQSCKMDENYRHYCPNVKTMNGVTSDGFFQEYTVVDALESAKLPDDVSFTTAAPLACAGRTIFRGVSRARAGMEPGQWLGIVGSGGGLGHLGIQFAKALDLKVVGVDARDEGLQLSESTGADVVVDARKDKDDVVKQVQDATDGLGCHVTLCLSDAKDAAALACAITRMHGRMIEIAQPDEVTVPFRELVFRNVHMEGSLLASATESDDMLKIVSKHNIKVEKNLFNGLDKVKDIIDLVHSGKIKGKGIIVVSEEEEKK